MPLPPLAPFEPKFPDTPVTAENRYQAQIGEKLADDFRVTGREARELVSGWDAQTYSPEQAELLRTAVRDSSATFDRRATRVITEFVNNRLPTLTQGVGAGIPSTSVRLTWTPPTAHVDGTPATDLAGYEVWYGTTPGGYTKSVAVTDRAATSTQIDNLEHGATYYFAIRALGSGDPSGFSNEVFKTVP